jgi:hypothetical protein
MWVEALGKLRLGKIIGELLRRGVVWLSFSAWFGES